MAGAVSTELYYNWSQDTGDTIVDNSGNNNGALNNGTTVLTSPDTNANVRHFNGASNIIVGASAGLASTDPHISYGAFFNYTSTPAVGTSYYIFSRYGDGYRIIVDNNNRVEYSVYADNTTISYIGSTPLSPGKSYLVFLTYDGSHLQGYLNDGVPDGPGIDQAATALSRTTLNWYIGSRSSNVSFLNGYIYTAYIDDSTLSQDDIKAIYQADKQLPPYHIINYTWSQDNGDAVIDDGYYGCNGTNYGSVRSLADTGAYARDFDGNDYIIVPNTGVQTITEANISYGAYFHYDTTPQPEVGYYIMSKYGDGYRILVDYTGKVTYDVYAADGVVQYMGTTVLDPGKDYLVALSYNGSHLQGYVNGKPDGAGTDHANGTLGHANSNWTIGAKSTDYSKGLDGRIYWFFVDARADNESVMQQYYDEAKWRGYSQIDFNKTAFKMSKTLGTGNVTVQMYGYNNFASTIAYTVTDGTARNGHEYTLASGTLNIPANSSNVTIGVPLINDELTWMSRRNFTITLSNPSSSRAIIGSNGSCTVSIGNKGGIALSGDGDAYVNSWANELPFLTARGVVETAYLTADVPFRNNASWRAEVDALNASGWEIADHPSVDAVSYPATYGTEAWLNNDIIPSIENLTSIGYPPHTFAYPFTHHNAASDTILLDYFVNLRGGGAPYQGHNINKTPYYYYDWDDSQITGGFALSELNTNNTLEDVYSGIDRAVQEGSVIILYHHKVADNVTGNPTWVLRSNYEALIDYAVSKDAKFYLARELNHPANISITTTSYSGNEGQDVTISLTKYREIQRWSSAIVTSADVTAHAGTDYTAVNQNITFTPGDTTKTFAVHLLNDRTQGADKSFTITLSNPVNATLGANTFCTVTITDNGYNADTDQANKLFNMGWVLILTASVLIVLTFLGGLLLIIRSGNFNPTIMIIIVAGGIVIGLSIVAIVLLSYVSGEIIEALRVFEI